MLLTVTQKGKCFKKVMKIIIIIIIFKNIQFIVQTPDLQIVNTCILELSLFLDVTNPIILCLYLIIKAIKLPC
jgi:hypothetical protein